MPLPILLFSALALTPASQDDGAPPQLGVELAAVAGQVQVTFDELDEVLIWRHGRSANGQETLRSLLDLTVLDHLAEEAGLVVGPEEIAARWGELEQEVKKAGLARDLFDYLAQNEIDPATFREHLRLAVVHEELTRSALGIGPDTPVTGEQQTLWLEGVHAERELVQEPHPWTAGVVARSGDLAITRGAFAEHLRTLVTHDEIGEVSHLIALRKVLRARMPDLADSALDEAVEAEIERRRARVNANPQYKGVKYEQLLDAQGLSVEALRKDPGLQVQALSYLWSDRTHDEASLRKAYETEREFFDARYGEAVDVYTLLLRAARFKNDFNPRTFEEAEAELSTLTEKIAGLEDFQRLAGELSEEGTTRARRGHMGRITAGMAAVPEPIRRAAFDAIEAARGEEGTAEVSGTLLGPIQVQGGVVLLCLGERYPAPTWDAMALRVTGELRRRMRDELLPRTGVALWLESR